MHYVNYKENEKQLSNISDIIETNPTAKIKVCAWCAKRGLGDGAKSNWVPHELSNAEAANICRSPNNIEYITEYFGELGFTTEEDTPLSLVSPIILVNTNTVFSQKVGEKYTTGNLSKFIFNNYKCPYFYDETGTKENSVAWEEMDQKRRRRRKICENIYTKCYPMLGGHTAKVVGMFHKSALKTEDLYRMTHDGAHLKIRCNEAFRVLGLPTLD